MIVCIYDIVLYCTYMRSFCCKFTDCLKSDKFYFCYILCLSLLLLSCVIRCYLFWTIGYRELSILNKYLIMSSPCIKFVHTSAWSPIYAIAIAQACACALTLLRFWSLRHTYPLCWRPFPVCRVSGFDVCWSVTGWVTQAGHRRCFVRFKWTRESFLP